MFAVLIWTSTASADSASLYAGPGSRPGPDILYAPLAESPALENTGVWHASPILVSGASAYHSGEFVYQDYLYDDHGANGNGETASQGPAAPGAGTWGTYTYPDDPRYAGNAADLVEVRLKLLADATAVRLTYDSMLDPNLVATTIGLGDSAGPLAMPHGANARQRAKVFVTVHGSSADAIDPTTGEAVSTGAPSASVDVPRRQVTVLIPFSLFDPRGQSSVRVSVASGLWDASAGKYLIPQGTADATHPGGAGNLSPPPAFFNVAFRSAEPRSTPFPLTTGFGNHQNSWRDYEQATALASGDLTRLYASVDFLKLASGADDDSGVPQSGYLNRIYVTHFPAGQGVGAGASLQPENCADPCTPTVAGDLQPYAIYVPPSPPPAGGYAMTLAGHGCSDNYNTFLEYSLADTLSRRAGGSIIATGEGRGPCYWYYGQGAADAFEMWADIVAHYPVNPDDAAVTGYSMGGYYTYKFAALFPDLFQAAAPLFGCVSAGTTWAGPAAGEASGGDASWVDHIMPSLRNVPIAPFNGATDPICTYSAQRQVSDTLDSLGYRYDELSVTDTHALFAGNDLYGQRISEFLDNHRLNRNPPHVTYVLNGEMNEPRFGVNADHAYWLSGLKLRDAKARPPLGSVDVRSQGFGVGDPPAEATRHGSGILTGGVLAPGVAYEEQSKAWGSPLAKPIRNELDITTKNISTLTVYAPRARVNCDAGLAIDSDGPLIVTLAGCPGGGSASTVVGRGSSICGSLRSFTIHLRHPRGTRVRSAIAYLNGRRLRALHAHGSRGGLTRMTVNLRHRPRSTYRFRIVMRAVAGHGRVRKVIDRRTYHTCRRAATKRHPP